MSTLFVVALHLLLFFVVAFWSIPPSKPKPHKPVAVREITVKERPAAPAPSTISAPPSTAPATIKTTSPAPPKKAEKKPAPKQQNAPSKNTHQDAIVSALQKTLQQVGGSKKNSVEGKKVGPLATEQATLDYGDELAVYLEEVLELPERCEMRIEVKVRRNGKVESVRTVEGSSEKNRDYLMRIVPTLMLPAFGKRYQGEVAHVFTIRLKNLPGS